MSLQYNLGRVESGLVMTVKLNIIANVSLLAIRLLAVKLITVRLEMMRLGKKVKKLPSPKNCLSPKNR